MSTYTVKEIFYTLQGEGAHAGRPSVFCRFTGCNLWTGREKDRHKATCQFCDTDFVGTDGENGGRYSSPEELAAKVASLWPKNASHSSPWVVCTGGEPLLQLDTPLIEAFQQHGFGVAVETNGTQTAPAGINWICVSPKAGAPLKLTRGQELKLVYPQPTLLPPEVASLEFENFYLQPMDGPNAMANTQSAVEYCLAHPQWKLSLQTHKMLGIP